MANIIILIDIRANNYSCEMKESARKRRKLCNEKLQNLSSTNIIKEGHIKDDGLCGAHITHLRDDAHI
jgi:hypothetical protein